MTFQTAIALQAFIAYRAARRIEAYRMDDEDAEGAPFVEPWAHLQPVSATCNWSGEGYGRIG